MPILARPSSCVVVLSVGLWVSTLAANAFADGAPDPDTGLTPPETTVVVTQPVAAPAYTLVPSAYVEAYYTYNFNRPSNQITAFRGFDQRHNTFAISNAALIADGTIDRVYGRVAVQMGQTGNAIYAGGEAQKKSGAFEPGTGPAEWRNLQQAFVGWNITDRVSSEVGLFLSPVGIEGLAVKDNWNWSRSNLFVGLPFYHTGLRTKVALNERWSITGAIYNGWNSVIDNNDAKTVGLAVNYASPTRTGQVMYLGGSERPSGAAEGQPWRHLFDAWLQLDLHKRFSIVGQANAGLERTKFGRATWLAVAALARAQALSWLYVAGRIDRFAEHVPSNDSGSAAPIFWPAKWVSSGTLTLDARPQDHLSIRLEVRHDRSPSSDPMFFKGAVISDPKTGAYVLDASSQTTFTAGATVWF